ncbi:MAG: ParB/Srx family N-terminal domain-containing protein [Magnetococcus sp. DMHC-6]
MGDAIPQGLDFAFCLGTLVNRPHLNVFSGALLSLMATLSWAKDPQTSFQEAKECDADKKNVGEEICRLPLQSAYLTQYSVGDLAAECKKNKIAHYVDEYLKKNPDKTPLDGLTDYLWNKSDSEGPYVPFIIGPNKAFYVTDHHHLGTAVWRYAEENDLDIKNIFLRAGRKEVTHGSADWREDFRDKNGKIDYTAFWAAMKNHNNAWFYDNNGDPLPYDKSLENPRGPFPENFSKTHNDPYRSISRWLRAACGYLKQDADCPTSFGEAKKSDYMEYRWANYVRDMMKDKVKGKNLHNKEERKDEEKLLWAQYPSALDALLKHREAKNYFSFNWNVDVDDYGFNNTGNHYSIKKINDHFCEVVDDHT